MRNTYITSCRMFENRVPHMLDNDYTPYSALDIFVKDLVRLATVIKICKLVVFFFFTYARVLTVGNCYTRWFIP